MIRVGVYGATGYTGYELVKILIGHPEVEVSYLTSETYKGKSLSEVFPCSIEKRLIGMEEADPEAVEAIFSCLPHTTAMELIGKVFRPGLKVVDLSADFRFRDAREYSRWYETEHRAEHLLPKSAYGLPELFREEIASCEIVGNPGCYPTAVLLGLAPAASSGLLAENEVLVDAKSGVSGAGRKADLAYNFTEVNENIIPYQIGRVHRHVGEMESVLSNMAGKEMKVVFTPQLAPFSRGILVTMYFRTGMGAGELRDLYIQRYRQEPFVIVLGEGKPAHLAYTLHNNCCVIGVHEAASSSFTVVTAAIDNLIKGAAGQAVQNFNILFGLEETAGLATSSGRI
jgi:N-acetyl-gamma-glutamyl-phosphate reductase